MRRHMVPGRHGMGRRTRIGPRVGELPPSTHGTCVSYKTWTGKLFTYSLVNISILSSSSKYNR